MDRLRREDPDGDSARAAMGAARCSRLSPAVPTVQTVDPRVRVFVEHVWMRVQLNRS